MPARSKGVRVQFWENLVIVRFGPEKTRMRKVWIVLMAVALGLGLGACSKCEIPDLLPKMCKAGPAAS